uniref:Uncharacterized protein n=1 Tax=Strigamia maritima TaxID=126957 RepID=T1IJK3_STRMM
PPTFIKRPQSFVVPSVQTVRFECEAQGNPPPKILWLKNGETIHTNGRIKIKNFELVILQTVTNDSGLYQCTAENTVGRVSADARLKINMSRDQPDPPTGLIARTLSSTSMELSWNASTSRNGLSIQAYTVHYALTSGGDELQKVALTPSFIVDMLKPYTNYSFYVRAYNGRSASDQSETIVWTTGEDSPLAAPSVALTSSGSTTLHIYWDQLSSDLARGVIVMYKIQWRRRNFPSHYIQEVSGDLHEYSITGLQPGSKYEVRVMGATKFGYPNLSDEMWPWVQHTMPNQGTVKGIPSSPVLDLTVVNATTVKVQWKMPESNEFVVTGFKLAHRRHNLKLWGPLIIPNNSTNYYILTDLMPRTWYEVHLIAYNENGDGRESVRPVQTYPEDNPEITYVLVESPSRLEAVPTNSTSILLSWKEPVTHKNISYFTVRYNPVRDGHVNASSVTYINSTDKDVLVAGLSPYTLYEFSVCSHNTDDIEGPYSSKVECKTKEDDITRRLLKQKTQTILLLYAVPSEPTDVNWTLLDTQSIRLTWKPPKFPNGIIISYLVTYDSHKDKACQVHKGITQEANGSEFASVLKGLTSNTKYYLCLRAKTRAGIGSATELVTLNIQTSSVRNHSSVQSSTSEEQHDPQLGIVLGFSIGITCVIICVFVIIFRNRCHVVDPLTHHYLQHGNKRTGCNSHVGTEGTREMESFMPMLTQINTNAPHLDTKGGYPMMCCNDKQNGYSHSVLYDKRTPKGRSKKNQQTMNITENPQLFYSFIESMRFRHVDHLQCSKVLCMC